MEMMDITCTVMPDLEEHRMLRALACEGVAVAHRGPYLARFHGWLVQVSRDGRYGEGCMAPVMVEIRCRRGGLLERICLLASDCADGKAARRDDSLAPRPTGTPACSIRFLFESLQTFPAERAGALARLDLAASLPRRKSQARD
ncbi:hypothetical protein [Paraburkholderia sp. SIMBA_030]|uniref:hypothetical protein n=1 Tax=Paraburkholderia sp. SIMBA_030 TaxID=3085773 RepID=UPI00397D0E69